MAILDRPMGPFGETELADRIAGDIAQELFGVQAQIEGASAAFFNRGYRIEFFHVPTGRALGFKSWLTSLEDNFESEWNPESVYGRMDPIMTFQGTKRTISLGWDVLAESDQEAMDNLKKIELLMMMLYPTYTKVESATSIDAPPLFKVKFMNLITDSFSGGGSVDGGGVTAAINGFTVSPDVEGGFFGSIGQLYPKKISLSCTMTILHTKALGWSSDNSSWQAGGFYNQGASMQRSQKQLAAEIGVELPKKNKKGSGADGAGEPDTKIQNQKEAAEKQITKAFGDTSMADFNPAEAGQGSVWRRDGALDNLNMTPQAYGAGIKKKKGK